jgi:predicted dehydrogenase
VEPAEERDTWVDVYGSSGSLHLGWKESRYRRSSNPDWIVFGKGYDKFDALRREVENFCRAIRGEEPLRISAADALASVEVVEAAYASLRSGGWVAVGDGASRGAQLPA